MANGNASTVESIKYRMKTLGVDLDKYIGRVNDHWNSTPPGFEFTCKDWRGLAMALIQNSHFAADTPLGGKMHKGVSWREVNRQDSLHIILSKGRTEKGKEPADTGSIHLDTVSVVAGRDHRTRGCIYDYGKVLQHLATDLKHTRFIVPTSEGGLVFGIQF